LSPPWTAKRKTANNSATINYPPPGFGKYPVRMLAFSKSKIYLQVSTEIWYSLAGNWQQIKFT